MSLTPPPSSPSYWPWVLAIAVIVLYISYYYRHPKQLTILQTSLADFKLEFLQEKQPIVIHDRVASLDSLLSAWFPSKLFNPRSGVSDIQESDAAGWIRHRYKFTFIQPVNQPIEVLLYPASAKMDPATGAPPPDATLVAIQLEPNQVIILPYKIHSIIPTPSASATPLPTVRTTGVHDLLTNVIP